MKQIFIWLGVGVALGYVICAANQASNIPIIGTYLGNAYNAGAGN